MNIPRICTLQLEFYLKIEKHANSDKFLRHELTKRQLRFICFFGLIFPIFLISLHLFPLSTIISSQSTSRYHYRIYRSALSESFVIFCANELTIGLLKITLRIHSLAGIFAMRAAIYMRQIMLHFFFNKSNFLNPSKSSRLLFDC